MARWLKVIDDVLKVKVHHLQTGRIKNSEFIDWVDKQPTIEEEHMKHGKWVKLDGEWKSSETGELIEVHHCSVCGTCYMNAPYNYCPYCGAKMDKGE